MNNIMYAFISTVLVIVAAVLYFSAYHFRIDDLLYISGMFSGLAIAFAYVYCGGRVLPK